MMPLLRYGFRPFFLAAGLAAMLLVPWWAASYAFGAPLGTSWPPPLWHGHEMLFGFILAAIAGFLLTAVPSWTGARGFAGRPLAMISGLWLLGRIAVATSQLWPPPAVAALDLAFLPALALLVAPPLVRARNRNTPLLAVLAALWATDAAFYWGLGHHNDGTSLRALIVGIDIVLLLITVLGGRIVPAFTASALKQRSTTGTIRAWPGITALAVGSMIALVLSDLFVPDGTVAGVIAALAAVIQAARIAQWQTLKTLRQPIVWVLHLAYLWLPIGLALKALALLTGTVLAAFWLHALTIGAAATMILAVMTRASLGHTGRSLVVGPVIALAYLLLTAAALVRVFGLAVLPIAYPEIILVAAFLWTAAFVLFTWIYAPMLLAPRADGKPG
jgi:uncharacterized protein involved in response to NO